MPNENRRPGGGAATLNVGLDNPFNSPKPAENQTSTWAAMCAARRWLIYDGSKKPHYADGAPRQGTLDTPEDLARLVAVDDARNAARAATSAPSFRAVTRAARTQARLCAARQLQLPTGAGCRHAGHDRAEALGL